jgi:hypothetical protein
MAIQQHIRDSAFDADTVRVMVDAYECARHQLQLASGDTDKNHRIADLVLAMAENGERDPQIICKRILLMMQTGL